MTLACSFRCWSLKFKQSDHQFLHQSNVFHHINNILSKSDDGDSEESFNISVQSGYEAMSQARKQPLPSFLTQLYSRSVSCWSRQIGPLVYHPIVILRPCVNLMPACLCVATGSLPGDLSEGPDQRGGHQDVQSSCHDWQPNRWLH